MRKYNEMQRNRGQYDKIDGNPKKYEEINEIRRNHKKYTKVGGKTKKSMKMQ